MVIIPLNIGAVVMPLTLLRFHVSVVTGPPDKFKFAVTVPEVYIAEGVVFSTTDQVTVPVTV
jgi:hypothetical protein